MLRIAYDLTRLFVGPAHATPRGIDRVELGYARHFLRDWPGEAIATLPTPLGTVTVERAEACRLLNVAERQWGEFDDPDADPLLERVQWRLRAGQKQLEPLSRRSRLLQRLVLIPHILRHANVVTGPMAADAVPAEALFLSMGQLGLAAPSFLRWLKKRPDVRSVFMLHDVIPLEHGDLVPEISRYFHSRMVDAAATHAAGIITSAASTAEAIAAALAARGRSDIPVLAELLPVAPAFARGPCLDRRFHATPYFIVVGSIEPRKNHALLFEVWQKLAEEGSPPKLVIAGTRWRNCRDILKPLNGAVGQHVIEVGGLNTASLRRLMANARGLLMPSFAEGFGLPIIEAQALGVPVVASDIPAHREAGGSQALYLSTSDGSGWLDAIRKLSKEAPGSRPLPAIRTWPEYLGKIEAFLERVAENENAGVVRTAA